jgi:hypothetical protein
MNNKENLFCPICKSKSDYIFNSKHNKKIFECSNIDCGHFFTPPNSLSQGICSRSYDIERESDDYLKIYGERNTRLLQFLKNNLPTGIVKMNLLDFGAGNAHISRTFKSILKEDANIYCLESNPLCKNLYTKFQLIQSEEIKDVPNNIDLIYMIEVIEHLIDPLEIMIVLRRKLNNFGILFLSTPCGKENENNTNAFDTPSHLHFFTEKSLNLVLEKSGFEPIIFKQIQEMYPLPSNKLYARLNYSKKLLLQFLGFYKIKDTNTHLVGITRSVKY